MRKKGEKTFLTTTCTTNSKTFATKKHITQLCKNKSRFDIPHVRLETQHSRLDFQDSIFDWCNVMKFHIEQEIWNWNADCQKWQWERPKTSSKRLENARNVIIVWLRTVGLAPKNYASKKACTPNSKTSCIQKWKGIHPNSKTSCIQEFKGKQ